MGYVVGRARFDERLFRAAAQTPGVTAFEGTLYEPERFPGRWVIGADGLRSRFHRRPEFPAAPPAERRVGLSTHVRGLEIDRDRVEVLLHDAGEVYLAPSDNDEALVACLFRQAAMPPGPENEDRVLHVLLSLQVLKGRTRGIAFTSPVLAVAPLGLRVGSVVSGDTLLVGDAAGAPDPGAGEGASPPIPFPPAGAGAVPPGRPRGH